MDKEFHYYLTYLTAARAGYPFDDALTIARTCQAVDENTRIIAVNSGTPQSYSNYISQTASLFRPRASRMRIYPVFHFIPGDSDHPSTKRTDRKTRKLNTTVDSTLANLCFDEASKTKDLMQIGIASHAYADTWAHQNFVGYNDSFNGFKGFLSRIIPNIGHADAMHYPDWPAHIWTDTRLIKANRIINNKRRFLDAARRLYEKFCAALDKTPDRNHRNSMLNDFDNAIGDEKTNSGNRGKSNRIKNYVSLSLLPEYNGKRIPDARLDDWKNNAINTRTIISYDGLNGTAYEWKTAKNYMQTKWFLFQEAIKKYQKHTLEIYQNSVYRQLEPGLLEEIMRFG